MSQDLLNLWRALEIGEGIREGIARSGQYGPEKPPIADSRGSYYCARPRRIILIRLLNTVTSSETTNRDACPTTVIPSFT